VSNKARSRSQNGILKLPRLPEVSDPLAGQFRRGIAKSCRLRAGAGGTSGRLGTDHVASLDTDHSSRRSEQRLGSRHGNQPVDPQYSESLCPIEGLTCRIYDLLIGQGPPIVVRDTRLEPAGGHYRTGGKHFREPVLIIVNPNDRVLPRLSEIFGNFPPDLPRGPTFRLLWLG